MVIFQRCFHITNETSHRIYLYIAFYAIRYNAEGVTKIALLTCYHDIILYSCLYLLEEKIV
jgi:hypothetical protein